MLIRAYVDDDQVGVVDLWQRCGLVKSWSNPGKDIARKLQLIRGGFWWGWKMMRY